MMILLRITHILIGVFWAGSAIYLALFLEPSVRAAGPAGGQVMRQLINRNFSQYAAGAAIITVLSGVALFWIDSDHFRSMLWIQTRSSTAYQVGGGSAIIALIIGLTMMRPTVAKIVALIAAAAPGTPPDPAVMAPLQERMKLAGSLVAALVTIAVICMAMARYI
jgi:uncharacterized membrane protein